MDAAQPSLYWIALIITVLSGAIYFWKNSAMLNESIAAAPEAPSPAPSPVTAPAPVAKETDFPAFKEWEGIVEALGHGAQILILRKGGIAEGRAGFQVKHPKFWLFPTGYHQQWEKTKPGLRLFASRPHPTR